MRDDGITLVFLSKGKVAIIDSADAERVLAFKWRWNGRYPARHPHKGEPASPHTIYMHRFILDAPRGVNVDHVDRDRLNNRRGNLRLCTMSQNLANTARHRDNSSGFKGVGLHKGTGRWEARVYCRGQKRYLGLFDDPVAAARAYDEAAAELFGEFAQLNFPRIL